MKMGQAIYQQQAAGGESAPADAEAAKPEADEEVVDAEFSEVDEDNKG